MCTAVLIGWGPASPPPPISPHLSPYTRAPLVSQYRRRPFVTPCWPVSAVSDGNVVIAQALPARPPLSWLAAAATSSPTTGWRGLRQVSLTTEFKNERRRHVKKRRMWSLGGGDIWTRVLRTDIKWLVRAFELWREEYQGCYMMILTELDRLKFFTA